MDKLELQVYVRALHTMTDEQINNEIARHRDAAETLTRMIEEEWSTTRGLEAAKRERERRAKQVLTFQARR